MSQPGPGGYLGLDPDLARVAIHKLSALRERLEEIRRDAATVAATPRTTFDTVARARSRRPRRP